MVRGRPSRVACLAALVIVLAMPAARAMTGQGQQMMRNWTASDRCMAAAQKQFPDYTAEALAKRDNAVKQCLGQSFLPPRAPLAPQSAPKP